MAEEPRRRRMSRHVSLVLLTSLPGLAGCGEREELQEVKIEPPPSGPEQVIGGPFIGWWQATHPPVYVTKTVQRSTSGGGTSRSRSRVFFVPIGGRSGFLSSGSSSPGPGSSHSAPVTRGGFGSTGHGAVGG